MGRENSFINGFEKAADLKRKATYHMGKGLRKLILPGAAASYVGYQMLKPRDARVEQKRISPTPNYY